MADTPVAIIGGTTTVLSGAKNLFINGDFSVWQRGIVFNVNNPNYTADRWFNSRNQQTTIRSTDVPEGFTYSIRVTRVGGANTGVTQGIELPAAGATGQFYLGAPFTVSLWGKIPIGTNFNLRFRFLDDASGTNASASQNLQTTLDGTGDWAYYSRDDAVITVSPNPTNLMFEMRLEANVPDGESVLVTGVQLEALTTVVSPFEYVMAADQLARCQRYYQVASHQFATIGWPTGTGNSQYYAFNVQFPTQMRVTPTVVLEPAVSQTATIHGAGTSGFRGQVADGVAGQLTNFAGYTADAEL